MEFPMKNFILRYILLFIFCIPSIIAQELKVVQLPAPQIDGGKTLMQALKLRQSSRSFDTKQIPLQDLSDLLWAANGINRKESGKRTAPSAMNWQETDIYVVISEGIYIYEAQTNCLNPIVAGDFCESTGKQGFVKDAPVNLVYIVDETRITRGSDDDKKLFSAIDVGFIAQNVYLCCASKGFSVVFRGMVDRSSLTKVINLKPSQRIIGAQTVGYPK
jgi:SagB-type dehydrogenase family enzyme